MLSIIQNYFTTQPVVKACVFGSFARGAVDDCLKSFARESVDADKQLIYERAS